MLYEHERAREIRDLRIALGMDAGFLSRVLAPLHARGRARSPTPSRRARRASASEAGSWTSAWTTRANAREAVYERAVLWTDHVLTAARRLYDQRGFALVEEAPHARFGPPVTGQTLALELQGSPRR